jgi:hypothetical protein
MSHKRIRSRCLVLDASLARAAGGYQTISPRGRLCREFLMSVRGICHRLAWGPRLREEWTRHRSVFATTWLTSMQNLRKLRTVADSPGSELLSQFVAGVSDRSLQAIIEKDAHLLVAALESDRRIASLDDTVRGHLASLSVRDAQLGTLCWVNPCVETEQAVKWLESGAPADASRQLRNYRK